MYACPETEFRRITVDRYNWSIRAIRLAHLLLGHKIRGKKRIHKEYVIVIASSLMGFEPLGGGGGGGGGGGALQIWCDLLEYSYSSAILYDKKSYFFKSLKLSSFFFYLFAINKYRSV